MLGDPSLRLLECYREPASTGEAAQEITLETRWTRTGLGRF